MWSNNEEQLTQKLPVKINIDLSNLMQPERFTSVDSPCDKRLETLLSNSQTDSLLSCDGSKSQLPQLTLKRHNAVQPLEYFLGKRTSSQAGLQSVEELKAQHTQGNGRGL